MLQSVRLRFQPVLLGKSCIGKLRVVVPATGTPSLVITFLLALPVKVPREVSTGTETDKRHRRPCTGVAPRI